MRVKAYAKLNLALDILSVHEDGMHELDMLMQSISLADVLSFKCSDRIEVRCDSMKLDGNNTVKRAAKLFFHTLGIRGGIQIILEKYIPAQAGLGGGSSDAAATLLALNHLYEAGLTAQELREIGVTIGADVPFFIGGGCARARGIGEKLVRINNRCRFYYLLVKPRKGVSTALAYRKYDERTEGRRADIDAAEAALRSGDDAAYFDTAKNVLQAPGIKICPEVGDILARCAARGADFAMMTGSGSCVFAVFKDESIREYAYRKFIKEYPFCKRAENVEMGIEVL